MDLISKETFIALCALYFFSNYKPKYSLFFCLMTIYQYSENFINYTNSIIYPEYFDFSKFKNELDEYNKNIEENNNFSKILPKYEDKYLEQIRNLDKEFKFDNDEEIVKNEKYYEFISTLKSQELDKFLIKLNEVNEKILKYEKREDTYGISESDSDYEEDDDIELVKTKQEHMKILTEEKQHINNQYDKLKEYLETDEAKEVISKDALLLATKFVINQKLDKLKNCYVMEKTPLGNVLMIYNNTRNTFSYYSDSTIPYRYLEVVARKYVKTFGCRPIFVDMDEELKAAEEKWDTEKEKKEEEERKKNEELKNQIHQVVEQKKSVFAKFKSYNKDSSATKAMVAPPKNSIPNKVLTAEQENEKILLKDKANRYTYEGKLSNFNFLKKVERKVVDKKYSLTFADFKKIQQK